MANIISDTSSFEDLVRIVNSLSLKINQLEKKINILQNNSFTSDYNMSNQVIVDQQAFRNISHVIPDEAPPVTRQNAFPFSMNS
jgi:hypothetical protein